MMKDICFLTGLVLGAGIGMVVATKNKQVKKVIECSEQSFNDAISEVKQSVKEPICECLSCECVVNSSETNSTQKQNNTSKKNKNN